jgi:hypothetical protein
MNCKRMNFFFPSHYRATRDSWYGSTDNFQEDSRCYLAFNMTIRWSRMVYDWYDKQPDHKHDMNRRPIVLDVDDIMTAPGIVIQYCNFVDLDPSKLKFNWKPMESDELEDIDPEFLRIKDTFHTSDGARQGKVVAGLVLGKRSCQMGTGIWRHRSSEACEWVQDAMPDYDYMWARGLTLPN